jgi:hypothetical protein
MKWSEVMLHLHHDRVYVVEVSDEFENFSYYVRILLQCMHYILFETGFTEDFFSFFYSLPPKCLINTVPTITDPKGLKARV